MNNHLAKKNPSQYKFQRELKVSWSDLDANGHVNSLAMARYFEDTRVDYLIEKFGFEEKGNYRVGCVLTELRLRYHYQILYPESVLITIGIVYVNRRKINMAMTLWNEQKRLVTSGYGTLLSYDFAQKKILGWPNSVYDKLKAELEA